MNTHIDTLAEWFDSAEDGDIHEGDTFIRHLPSVGRFVVGVAEEYLCAHPGYRILHRAPIPKPAWHDAVAVIAHTDDGHIRQVWERDGDTDYWCGTEGYLVRTEKLHDVTPMLEAKVTDEMVERARNAPSFDGRLSPTPRLVREMLTAALGLETA